MSSKNESAESIDEEMIGDEGTNLTLTNPLNKMTKSPGMLMNNSSKPRSSRPPPRLGLEDRTDEFNDEEEEAITAKMKATEFKVNRGLSGN